MNAPGQTSAEWPERIYYVCNSGSGIVVNATPLVQAGAERIEGMRILCGVGDPKRPTPAEQRESMRPAERLITFADRLGIKAVDDPIYGASDSYGAWSNVLNEVAKRAKDLGATVVYNVTGGPRALPLAAILGASNEVRASMAAVAVSFSDRTCTRLIFNANGELAGEHPLPAHSRIGFDGLVTLYGYREQDRARRLSHEAFISEHRTIAKRVASETQRPGRKHAIAALHRSMQFDSSGNDRGASATPFCVAFSELKARPGVLRSVIEPFGGLDGLEIIRDGTRAQGIRVETETARRFIGGIWLEAAVFGLVCDVFESTRAEVVAGAVLAVEGRPPPGSNTLPDDTELDVAVVLDDQLHVIEVKAITGTRSSGGRFGDHVAKLVKIRQELGSQVMRSFLVAPLLSKSDFDRGSFTDRAGKQGVRLRYGPDAIERLVQELGKLL